MLTQERLKSIIHYDPDTGHFYRKHEASSPVNIRYIGDTHIVGSLNKKGYRSLSVDGIRYCASHLAFLYMEGRFPAKEMDHINRVVDDNRWCNLREATRLQNAQNRGPCKTSKTGMKGVYPDSRRPNTYIVQIKVDKVRHHVGTYHSLEAAQKAYIAASKDLQGEFSPFR